MSTCEFYFIIVLDKRWRGDGYMVRVLIMFVFDAEYDLRLRW